MSDKPPFDPQRAAFWLIAVVIFIECLIALAGALSCLWFAETIIKDPAIVCDPNNRLMQILNNALAAALALWGIRNIPKE
jgi:hypothetical protein